MSGRIIDGREIAADMIALLKNSEAKRRTTKVNGEPRTFPEVGLGALAVVGVDATVPSMSFLRQMRHAAAQLGIVVRRTLFHGSLPLERFMALLGDLGKDPNVGGIVVLDGSKWPIDRRLVAAALHPQKDPDCISEANLNRVSNFRYRVVPPVVIAMNVALSHVAVGTPISKNVVVVGAGRRVGRPIIHWLVSGGAASAITVLRSTSTLADCIRAFRHADIIIGAASCPEVLNGYLMKPGVIVIDFSYPPNCNTEQLVRLGATVICHIGPVVVAALLKNFVILNT